MNFRYYIKHHNSIKCLLKMFIYKINFYSAFAIYGFKVFTIHLMQMCKLSEYI